MAIMEKQSAAVDAVRVAGAGAPGSYEQPPGDGKPGRAAAASADGVDARLPLVIGVTGHRDLRSDARAAIAAQVQDILLHFKNSYPSTPLVLLSPLAEGADRLVAEVALETGIGASLMAPLPMPREIYPRDFATGASRAEFDRLLAAASQSLAIPTPPCVNAAQLQNDSRARQNQYAAVGEFIARHCQVLIALWDGKPGERGGTGEVVKLKLTGSYSDTPPGADSGTHVPRRPICHVRVPRQRDETLEAAVTTTPIYPESDDYEPSQAHDFYHFQTFN